MTTTRQPVARMTESDYRELSESYIGICKSCGEHRDMCEPDARNYPCECCGKNAVDGLEWLMVGGQIELLDDGDD